MEQKFTCQVVAMPYPGRGHMNPMMNLCKLIAMRRPNILVTFIVTEEWHGFLSYESKPVNIRFGRIPNVIPSEIGRAKDYLGFVEAIMTKMEGPVECLLDQLEPPVPSVIIYDTILFWVVGLANRRNIPAASFWTQSATMFSILNSLEVLLQNGHFPFYQLDAKRREEQVKYIPGVPLIGVQDLPRCNNGEILQRTKDFVALISKPQYLLLSSIYELESQVIDSLKIELPIPIYSIGPTIPYLNIREHGSQTCQNDSSNYITWLDAQPRHSVLYISQGSYLSASNDQFDELVAGLRDSGVRFFWVLREDISTFHAGGSSDKGFVAPWCEQLKVLCHPSVGGFWSHCGWNSAKEAAFAGIPILTFPITWDQFTNSKQIVEDWKIGWRVKRHEQSLVTREDISKLLKKFMDLECEEGKEMRRRAQDLRVICQRATAEGGSSDVAIEAFIKNISK